MRVLLLGEFSGFFTNLKQGLQELGVDVVLASCNDSWKKIAGSDIQLFNRNYNNSIEKFYNLILEPYLRRNQLQGFDVVQMIHPIPYSTYINKVMFDYLKKNNGKVFVSVAGDCYSVYRSYLEGKIGYYVYDNNPENCKLYDNDNPKALKRIDIEKYVYNNVDGIIPIMYEYAVGVRELPNCKKTIQLPFDCSKIEYKPNKIIDGKIVIAHGIIREEYKGSSYIKEAMKIIREKYPDKVEIAIDGRMPLQDYLKWLDRANVLIDQCKEHCYGMNALYAMAKGRVVLGGASRNSMKEFELDSCPVIHIKPDVDQIVDQIDRIIKNEDKIERMGYESRKFVEEFHDCKKIAKMYLDTWKGTSEL